MNSETLLELDADSLKTSASGLLGKIRDAGIAGLGSTFGIRTPKARGRLNIRILTDELLNRWYTYLSTQRHGGNNVEGNEDDLRDFIRTYFGNESLKVVEPVIRQTSAQTKPAQTATQPTQTSQPQSTIQPAQTTTSLRTQQQEKPVQRQGFATKSADILPFGRKGTDRPAYVAPKDIDQPAPKAVQQPQPQAGVTGRREPYLTRPASKEDQQNVISKITGALSRTKEGSDARKKVVAYIRSLQNNPRTVAKYPEIAQIRANESINEAEMKRSIVDAVFRRLAAYEMETGRAFVQEPNNKSSEKSSNRSPQHNPRHSHNHAELTASKPVVKNPTTSLAHTMERKITPAGLKSALEMPRYARYLNPKEIEALQSTIEKHPSSINDLFSSSEFNHMSVRIFPFLAIAAERS